MVVVAVYVDNEELTKTELMVAKLLFGWQCPSPWQRFTRFVNLIGEDAFFDLFLMLCIVANTVLMALDHADISITMANVLSIGNYVSFSNRLMFQRVNVFFSKKFHVNFAKLADCLK
jgi:hypothetical protein